MISAIAMIDIVRKIIICRVSCSIGIFGSFSNPMAIRMRKLSAILAFSRRFQQFSQIFITRSKPFTYLGKSPKKSKQENQRGCDAGNPRRNAGQNQSCKEGKKAAVNPFFIALIRQLIEYYRAHFNKCKGCKKQNKTEPKRRFTGGRKVIERTCTKGAKCDIFDYCFQFFCF